VQLPGMPICSHHVKTLRDIAPYAKVLEIQLQFAAEWIDNPSDRPQPELSRLLTLQCGEVFVVFAKTSYLALLQSCAFGSKS